MVIGMGDGRWRHLQHGGLFRREFVFMFTEFGLDVSFLFPRCSRSNASLHSTDSASSDCLHVIVSRVIFEVFYISIFWHISLLMSPEPS